MGGHPGTLGGQDHSRDHPHGSSYLEQGSWAPDPASLPMAFHSGLLPGQAGHPSSCEVPNNPVSSGRAFQVQPVPFPPPYFHPMRQRSLETAADAQHKSYGKRADAIPKEKLLSKVEKYHESVST